MEELRLGIGGPFWRVERAVRVERLRRLIPLLLALTWAPLVGFALVHWAVRGSGHSLIRDVSVHTRLLVAMPLIVAAERLLDQSTRASVTRAFDEGLIPPASGARVRAMLRAVASWRDAAWPESLLLVAALALGVAALAGWIAPGGVLSSGRAYPYDTVRVWYCLASLPVFQFLLWRSLFRFALWLRVFVGLALTPLRLVATHGDRRGGIAFLRMPSVVYGALLTLATSAVMCGNWAMPIVGGTPVSTFRSPFLVFVALAVIVVLAPLLALTPQLWRVRVTGLRRYGGLMTDYAQRFEARWIDGRDRTSLLGTPDIRSLSDMTNAYQSSVTQIGVTLFSKRDALTVAAAASVPVVPLLFLQGPAHEVIKRLAALLLGVAP